MTNQCNHRLTVGLPVYNGENFIADAIESIINQTYQDWVLLVCDNASTDRTQEICRQLAAHDPRIRYVRNDTNIGLAPNFNKAFQLSSSEFFKWQAHDDVCLPDFFERCITALDAHPKAALAFPWAAPIDGEGSQLDQFLWNNPAVYDQDDPATRFRQLTSTFDRLTRSGSQSPGSYIFGVMRSESIKNTRLQMSHMWADISLLAELSLEGTFVEVPEVLLLLRVEIENATSHMLRGDLQGWQRILDPKHSSKLGTIISRYRRYGEYFVSVWRSRLPLTSKLGLTHFCTTLLARRAYDLALKRH
jgi:glycosyltransferase involved in cell wall biosynthesis